MAELADGMTRMNCNYDDFVTELATRWFVGVPASAGIVTG
jgi:hypothetical protein